MWVTNVLSRVLISPIGWFAREIYTFLEHLDGQRACIILCLRCLTNPDRGVVSILVSFHKVQATRPPQWAIDQRVQVAQRIELPYLVEDLSSAAAANFIMVGCGWITVSPHIHPPIVPLASNPSNQSRRLGPAGDHGIDAATSRRALRYPTLHLSKRGSNLVSIRLTLASLPYQIWDAHCSYLSLSFVSFHPFLSEICNGMISEQHSLYRSD